MPKHFTKPEGIKKYQHILRLKFTVSDAVHMATHFLRHWIPFKLPTCKLFYDVGCHKKYRHVLQFKFMMSDVVHIAICFTTLDTIQIADTFYDIRNRSDCRHVYDIRNRSFCRHIMWCRMPFKNTDTFYNSNWWCRMLFIWRRDNVDMFYDIRYCSNCRHILRHWTPLKLPTGFTMFVPLKNGGTFWDVGLTQTQYCSNSWHTDAIWKYRHVLQRRTHY